jgi:hypothetical protein
MQQLETKFVQKPEAAFIVYPLVIIFVLLFAFVAAMAAMKDKLM